MDMEIGSAVRSVGRDRRPIVGKLVGWASRDAAQRRVALIEPFGASFMTSRVASWRFMEPLTPNPTVSGDGSRPVVMVGNGGIDLR